ncbi:MAG TPA: carbon storage regulator CsrA [Clostridia bacterium]|nr:carbon storage regulator CsrA [Clostridia bacterium]
MLVLSRKKMEALLIGEEIKITVIGIEGDKVKLGIEAPENLTIYREEIYEAIKAENKEAAVVDPDALQELLNLPQK